MKQTSSEKDFFPSEQAVTAQQGRLYLMLKRKVPTETPISSCTRLHDHEEPVLKDFVKECQLTSWKVPVSKEIPALNVLQ